MIYLILESKFELKIIFVFGILCIAKVFQFVEYKIIITYFINELGMLLFIERKKKPKDRF